MKSKVELKLERVFAKVAAIAVCVLLPAISSASQDTDAINARASAMKSAQSEGNRVYMVQGSVFVTPGKNPAHRVIDSEAIGSDTLVSTGEDSAALLKFEDGQIVTMRANSTFRVREYRYNARKVEDSSIIFSLLKGGMRFVTGLIGQRKKQAFRLLTPNATLGIRGTEFMVAMVDNSLYSQVQAGKISMTNAAGVSVIGAGQSAVVASSGALAAMISASAIPAGTFGELLSIPVDPSAISAPAPAPADASIPADASGAVTSAAGTTGAAASVAGASIGVAGGALAGVAGSDSDSTQTAAQPVEPAAVAVVQEPVEPAKTADDQEMYAESKSGTALTGKIGTLGLGAELNLGISENFSARFGVNGFNYKYNANSASVNYDFKMQLQTASAIADWYPFSGGFRTSGGLFYNNNKFGLTGKPTGGTFTIGNTTYPSGDISSLQADVSFNTVAPYLGIGWGNPVATGKGLGITTDIGVLLQGSPKVNMVVTCATTCNTLQADADAERIKLQNDMSNLKWWPVASIGISYQW
ncbi:MAG: FecR family protein [Pseudomonadota bacterium]